MERMLFGRVRGPGALVQLLFKLVADERPNLLFGVLPGDLSPDLGVEVLRAGAGRLAGDGEAVAQDQHAEGQEVKRRTGRRASHDARVAAVVADNAVHGREVVLAGDVGLQIGRRDAWRGLALGLNFALDGAVAVVGGFNVIHDFLLS